MPTLIQKGKIDYVKDAMEQSTESGTDLRSIAVQAVQGRQDFQGRSHQERRLQNNVGLQIRLSEGTGASSGKSSNLADLAIHDEEENPGRMF